jgi:hypothetical protein
VDPKKAEQEKQQQQQQQHAPLQQQVQQAQLATPSAATTAAQSTPAGPVSDPLADAGSGSSKAGDTSSSGRDPLTGVGPLSSADPLSSGSQFASSSSSQPSSSHQPSGGSTGPPAAAGSSSSSSSSGSSRYQRSLVQRDPLAAQVGAVSQGLPVQHRSCSQKQYSSTVLGWEEETASNRAKLKTLNHAMACHARHDRLAGGGRLPAHARVPCSKLGPSQQTPVP